MSHPKIVSALED